MANTIFPLFRPIVEFWHEITTDQTLAEYQEFKGGPSKQHTWLARIYRSETDRVYRQRQALQRRFQEEPRLYDFFWDNALRLTVFSGLERVFTLQQAYPILGQNAPYSSSFGNTLTDILSHGAFAKGYLRGSLLNLFQWTGVFYNNLAWAHGSSLQKQILYSFAFETLFYPLDTLKTLLYSDVGRQYKGLIDCLGTTIQDGGIKHLYRGLLLKLSYNAAFLFHLQNWYEQSQLTAVSLPVWLLSYGALSLKTRLQIADTPVSQATVTDIKSLNSSGIYRGLLPFALLNLLLSYQLFGFYTPAAQTRAIEELEYPTQISPADTDKWEHFRH